MLPCSRRSGRELGSSIGRPIHQPLAGNGVERTLAVGTVGQNAAALIETCLLRRRFGRGQQQQLELRNAGFVAPGLPRQIGQLFTMVKGEMHSSGHC